jgi:hypothetical protein
LAPESVALPWLKISKSGVFHARFSNGMLLLLLELKDTVFELPAEEQKVFANVLMNFSASA